MFKQIPFFCCRGKDVWGILFAVEIRIWFSFQTSSPCSCLWCIPRYAFRALGQHEISSQPFWNMFTLNLLINVGYLKIDEFEKALVFLKIWTLKYYLGFQVKWKNRIKMKDWNCTSAVACSSIIVRPLFFTKTNIKYNKAFFSSGRKTRKKIETFLFHVSLGDSWVVLYKIKIKLVMCFSSSRRTWQHLLLKFHFPREKDIVNKVLMFRTRVFGLVGLGFFFPVVLVGFWGDFFKLCFIHFSVVCWHIIWVWKWPRDMEVVISCYS